jgi:hypothetical protein
LEKNQVVAPWEYHHRWLGYLREKGLVLDSQNVVRMTRTSSTTALLLLEGHSVCKLFRTVHKDAGSGSSLEGLAGANAVDIGSAREIRPLVYSMIIEYSHRRATTCSEGLGGAVSDALGNLLSECQGSSREEGSDECETCNHGVFFFVYEYV